MTPDDPHNQISGGVFFSAVIQGRDITVRLPPRITPALSGLPAGSSAFTGRADDLKALLDALAPHPAGNGRPSSAGEVIPAPAVTAVAGMGGVGKTELAIQAARTALTLEWFPGGVLFVDLFGYDPGRRLDAGQALEGFLRALGIPGEHIPSGTQERGRLYVSALSAYAQARRPILVVVDNASDPDQVRPLLPAASGCRAIVTSRHTLGMLDARLLDLNVLTPDEAMTLLGRVIGVARPGDRRVGDHPADAAEVARLCGYLPLALRIVAALLADDPARPLPAMVADLADASSRLTELEYGDVAVRAAFELSYRHLPPAQARLFRLLPVNPGPDISTSAAAVLTGQDPAVAAPVRRLLEGLARAHLIEPGSTYGRWRTHDLVRLFADQHGEALAEADGRAQAFDALLQYYLITTQAAVPHLDPNRDTTSGGPDAREQALMWLDAEHLNLSAATHTAAARGIHAFARDLPIALALFLTWRRHLNDQITLSAVSREAARGLGDRMGEGSALSILGAGLTAVRRFDEAVAALRSAATIFQDTGYRQGNAAALVSLGFALREMRRFDEAVAALRNAATIFRDIGDRQGEAVALGNLGTVLAHVRRFDEAIATLRNTVAILRDTGHRHSEAEALTSLGLALAEVGRFDEAISAHTGAAAVFRETDDRHGEAGALNNLGIALREVRRCEEAITTLRNAAAAFRETGDRHGEGTALDNLGNALDQVRRFDEAVVAHTGAAAIFDDSGDRHGEARALDNLGITLGKVGRFDEAVTAHVKAAAIFRELGDRNGEEISGRNLAATGERAKQSPADTTPRSTGKR
ncbi:tetratricopeptide repeat protein [Sphaerisporangium sp. NPDC088356]|uniref:ATP-binding protein n=1 Tax=Sphaerisporangium sp. NPDC088356 TaxID=3154871 RepID=UPI0034431835